MFVRDLFRYDEEEHKGYYCGELVPSITQLLEIVYPLDENIPTKNLKNAANRGTQIHELIEHFNKSNGDDLTQLLIDTNVLNYYAFLKTLGMNIHKCEELVFLKDENNELIAYGHFDFVLKCLTNNVIGEQYDLVLGDLKTTSEINKAKVKLQTELYRVAYEQTFMEQLAYKTFVLHLRDGKIKFIPFVANRETDTIRTAKVLREEWENARKS